VSSWILFQLRFFQHGGVRNNKSGKVKTHISLTRSIIVSPNSASHFCIFAQFKYRQHTRQYNVKQYSFLVFNGILIQNFKLFTILYRAVFIFVAKFIYSEKDLDSFLKENIILCYKLSKGKGQIFSQNTNFIKILFTNKCTLY